MDRVELMATLPAFGEEYQADSWRLPAVNVHEAWKSDSPLIVDPLCVAHVRVVGAAGQGYICGWMSELIGGLQAFKDHLVDLIKELQDLRDSPVVPSRYDFADSDQPVLSASADRMAIDSVVIRVLYSVDFSLAIPIAHRCN